VCPQPLIDATLIRAADARPGTAAVGRENPLVPPADPRTPTHTDGDCPDGTAAARS